MHFLRPFLLADDLALNRVSRVQGGAYFLGYLIIDLLIFRYSMWAGRPIDLAWYVETIAELVITILGVLYCWRSNGGKDGPDFVFRVVCLSVPVGIIITIAGFGAGIILRWMVPYAYKIIPIDPFIIYYIVIFAQFLLLSCLFWFVIGQALRRARRQLSETSTDAKSR